MNQRVAIAIEESGGKELVAQHFGRCTKFTVTELDDHQTVVTTETYFNPLAGQHSGACQIPGYVNQFNITAIISGGMGRKALGKFFQFGINVITAPGLLAEEALKLFRQGILTGYESCLHDQYRHHAMSSSITDCQVVVVRGMGEGAVKHLRQANLIPVLTGLHTIDEVIQAVAAKSLDHDPRRIHLHHGDVDSIKKSGTINDD